MDNIALLPECSPQGSFNESAVLHFQGLVTHYQNYTEVECQEASLLNSLGRFLRLRDWVYYIDNVSMTAGEPLLVKAKVIPVPVSFMVEPAA